MELVQVTKGSNTRTRPVKIHNDDNIAQQRLNQLSTMKSYDSKDMRDEINKAMKCKKNGKMIMAVRHLKLGREMLENMIQRLEQKDKMKALEYFKKVF